MKKNLAIFTAAIAAFTGVAGAGCNKKAANNAETLEIFIADYGYGYEWLEDQIALFKEQSWVKEKYPNLDIPKLKTNNSDREYALSRVVAGNSNTIDLFFSCQSAGVYSNKTDPSTGKSYFEDLTGVYESFVPGESVTLKEKMLADVYRDYKVTTTSGETAYYGMPWVNGYMGLLYNKTLLKQTLGENYAMPRTTKELAKMAGDIKTASKNAIAPFIFSASANYWMAMFQTWWAQYDGIEGYKVFWNGIIDDEYSSEIFNNNDLGGKKSKYRGRYESLKAIESLIGKETGNVHGTSSEYIYSEAQKEFLKGKGMMMPNGDWFDMEMSKMGNVNPNNYEVTFMKTPVISTLINELKGVKDDFALGYVVDCVDGNKTYAEAKSGYESEKSKFAAASQGELSEEDYNRVKQARGVMYRLEGHDAYIPAYATGKEAAKDFLRFLATDVSIGRFMKSTKGCVTAYTYDAENSPLWNEISTMQKDHIKYYYSGVQLPIYTSFKLAYFGGLTPLTQTPRIDYAFVAQSETDRTSPEKMIADDYNYFAGDNDANFKLLLTKAGINA